jgi:hypothetical protein
MAHSLVLGQQSEPEAHAFDPQQNLWSTVSHPDSLHCWLNPQVFELVWQDAPIFVVTQFPWLLHSFWQPLSFPQLCPVAGTHDPPLQTLQVPQLEPSFAGAHEPSAAQVPHCPHASSLLKSSTHWPTPEPHDMHGLISPQSPTAPGAGAVHAPFEQVAQSSQYSPFVLVLATHAPAVPTSHILHVLSESAKVSSLHTIAFVREAVQPVGGGLVLPSHLEHGWPPLQGISITPSIAGGFMTQSASVAPAPSHAQQSA